MGQPRLFFVYFRHNFNNKIEKSVDGVLGIQTWDSRIVPLRRAPLKHFFIFTNHSILFYNQIK